MIKKKSKKAIEIENPVVFPSIAGQSEETNEQKTIIQSNFFLLWLFFNLVFLIIAGRVFYLQILKGNHYQKIAENNRIRNIEVKAPRGVIVDRKGKVLASSIPKFDVVFIPYEMPKKANEREYIYSDLASQCGLKRDKIKTLIEEVGFENKQKHLLETGVGYEKALALIENLQKIPGIYLEKTTQRKYEDGEQFSSILGYTGKITEKELSSLKGYSLTDHIGKSGLEYTYEKWLKGKHGKLKTEVDSNGKIKKELGISPPVSGNKLILNIDSELQKRGYETLEKVLQINEEATGATLVAIDPRNGAVRSLVSLPSYDNNSLVGSVNQEDYQKLFKNSEEPMLNRAIGGEYSPGSTFKPLLAFMGLEEGVINKDTTIKCSGSISVGAWSFKDWKTHGITKLKKAIAESCNIYFYSVGGGWNGIGGLGIDRMSKYSEYFGLGNALGIDLPWETSGIVPSAEWKFKKLGEKWYIGDTYHMSIGQGFLNVTPLQMASAISVIANEGILFQPKIVNKMITSEGREIKMEEKILSDVFSNSENFEKVKEAMRETVVSGSGRSLANMKTETAGKTGTAQFGNQNKTHSWYVSFAPFNNPEIVTVVLIEAGGEGHDWAVPVTEQILREYFNEDLEDIDWSKIKDRVEARDNH